MFGETPQSNQFDAVFDSARLNRFKGWKPANGSDIKKNASTNLC